MQRLAVLLSTCVYVGYFPIAPGTAGSAAGLLVCWALRHVESPALEVATIIALFLVGMWSATEAERYFGTPDPGPVVLDEVVGILITLAFIPMGWNVALLGFFVFRVFDVVKPYPSPRFERWPGGLGVMADDAMAGIYANLVVRGGMALMPTWFA